MSLILYADNMIITGDHLDGADDNGTFFQCFIQYGGEKKRHFCYFPGPHSTTKAKNAIYTKPKNAIYYIMAVVVKEQIRTWELFTSDLNLERLASWIISLCTSSHYI